MPQAFRMKKGAESIEIAGVGVLDADAGNSISLEEAALTMAELQEQNADGSLKLDKHNNPKPLTGAELTKAAREWADAHDGIEVVQVSKEDLAESDIDSDDLLEKSKRRWEETYKHLKPVNDNPEEMTLSGADAAAIAIAAAQTKED